MKPATLETMHLQRLSIEMFCSSILGEPCPKCSSPWRDHEEECRGCGLTRRQAVKK